MMIDLIITFLARTIVIITIIDVLLGYFLSPYHKIRLMLDGIVNPLLNPIRRVLPSIGGIDFSPVILIILVQILEYILISIL